MVFLSFNSAITRPEDIADDDEALDTEDTSEELPLRFKWVIWQQLMSSQGKAVQYHEATRPIAECDSVEGFWRLWARLPQPSELLQNRMESVVGDRPLAVDALMIFRDGVRPQWEDKENSEGGHFQFHLKATTSPGQLDEHWNNLVLGVVGATIEPADMITGLRLVDKLSAGSGGGRGAGGVGNLRLEVWFNDVRDQQAVHLLQENVERCIGTRTLEGRVYGAPPRAELKNHRMTRHQ
eukprot:TRINITY_DN54172_c0_g1_i1.p1 TRINITY_DN54172_c0_g1~~TRINITY_DN54172_c0_g1_i1.p1  ORF type:complete len:258 (-),score=66.75 TRINITY_DN54172_c0_g1_i1:64-777(-)